MKNKKERFKTLSIKTSVGKNSGAIAKLFPGHIQ
jgi:hypothetical protein